MIAKPKRILVTGGSGFVGGHLCRMLQDRFVNARISAPHVDIRDAAAVDHLVHERQPDVCIHLAAVSTIRAARDDEANAWRTNLCGTLSLARAIMHHARDCTLLFASSADAYGGSFRQPQPLTEDSALAPLNVYGATKAAADLALGAMAEQGLRVVRARAFNHTGPGQQTGLVVPAFARHIARIAAGLQPPVMTVGNLDARRDFLDVRDVCAGYIACIDHRDALLPGTVLNLASGLPRRIGDILHDLLSMAGVQAEIQVDPSLLRANDIPIAHGDATRARTIIGWQPATPWPETLRVTLDDWRNRVRAEVK